jgi:cytochrome c553
MKRPAHRKTSLSRTGIAAGFLQVASLVATGAAFGQDKPKIKGDPAFGEYLSSLCVTCHQPSGKAVGGIPPIVAWPEEQFIAVLNSYRWKERDNEVMQTVTAQLTDEEIAALAAYFGGLANQPEINK